MNLKQAEKLLELYNIGYDIYLREDELFLIVSDEIILYYTDIQRETEGLTTLDEGLLEVYKQVEDWENEIV